jgi:N-acyl-D-amino-acid deacylase
MTDDRVSRVARSLADRSFSRRAALRAGGVGVTAATVTRLGGWSAPAGAQEATPTGQGLAMTGQDVPELAGFDRAIADLMPSWHVPGGQLAVAWDGRLVLNRGYGLADVDRQVPVQPDALFRVASAAKAITAVAILTLVDEGKLALDDRAFPLLGLSPAANASQDPRLDTITVEQLLTHAGGWDSTQSFDPQYLPWCRMAAATLGLEDPPEPTTIVRYMLGVPLDFDPGSKSVYSNFGFNVLGRIIEHVSGQPYAEYVRDHVLTPAGITDMRLGRTRLDDRAPGEVRYYSPPELGLSESVYWGEGYVPLAYGSYAMEAVEAHGGWIASAADLARFAMAVDGQRGTAILSPESVEAMISTPRPKESGDGSGWDSRPVTAGLGWDMKPVANGVEWSKPGALGGTSAALVFRGADRLTFAFAFNSLPDDFRRFVTETGRAILAAAGAVESWPTHDLFT